MSDAHGIDELRVRVAFPSKAAAVRTQQDVVPLIRERLMSVVSDVFDQVSAGSGCRRFDRIDVDLGRIRDLSDFGLFENRLRRRLRDALGTPEPPGSTVAERSERRADVVPGDPDDPANAAAGMDAVGFSAEVRPAAPRSERLVDVVPGDAGDPANGAAGVDASGLLARAGPDASSAEDRRFAASSEPGRSPDEAGLRRLFRNGGATDSFVDALVAWYPIDLQHRLIRRLAGANADWILAALNRLKRDEENRGNPALSVAARRLVFKGLASADPEALDEVFVRLADRLSESRSKPGSRAGARTRPGDAEPGSYGGARTRPGDAESGSYEVAWTRSGDAEPGRYAGAWTRPGDSDVFGSDESVDDGRAGPGHPAETGVVNTSRSNDTDTAIATDANRSNDTDTAIVTDASLSKDAGAAIAEVRQAYEDYSAMSAVLADAPTYTSVPVFDGRILHRLIARRPWLFARLLTDFRDSPLSDEALARRIAPDVGERLLRVALSLRSPAAGRLSVPGEVAAGSQAIAEKDLGDGPADGLAEAVIACARRSDRPALSVVVALRALLSGRLGEVLVSLRPGRRGRPARLNGDDGADGRRPDAPARAQPASALGAGQTLEELIRGGWSTRKSTVHSESGAGEYPAGVPDRECLDPGPRPADNLAPDRECLVSGSGSAGNLAPGHEYLDSAPETAGNLASDREYRDSYPESASNLKLATTAENGIRENIPRTQVSVAAACDALECELLNDKTASPDRTSITDLAWIIFRESPGELRRLIDRLRKEEPRRFEVLVAALPEALLAAITVRFRPVTGEKLLAQAEVLAGAYVEAACVADVPLVRACKWACVFEHALDPAADDSPRVLAAALAERMCAQGAGANAAAVRRRVARALSVTAVGGHIEPETLRGLLAGLEDRPPADRAGMAELKPVSLRHGVAAGAKPVSLRHDEAVSTLRVGNAGLVIAAVFLPRLYRALELTTNDKLTTDTFVDSDAALRAAQLSQWIVDLEPAPAGTGLALNKLLCGLDPQAPVGRHFAPGDRELTLVRSLLENLLVHWTALGNTSVPGLQASFLQRSGRLSPEDGGWRLTVEPRAYDMLLDRLPWCLSPIKLPWMRVPLHVDWR